MTVELVDYALLDLESAMAYLDIGDPTGLGGADEDLVTALVNETTDYCEWWCNRPLAAREFADLRFPAQAECVLRPRATPIDVESDITIDVDGVAQTVWATEADGDPALKDVIVGADADRPSHFWRSQGWIAGSARNPYPIRISYTGGFSPIPGQLAKAAKLVLENLYRSQKKKLTSEIAGIGAGPVAPGITFRGELIPMQAKQILDSYRLYG